MGRHLLRYNSGTATAVYENLADRDISENLKDLDEKGFTVVKFRLYTAKPGQISKFSFNQFQTLPPRENPITEFGTKFHPGIPSRGHSDKVLFGKKNPTNFHLVWRV